LWGSEQSIFQEKTKKIWGENMLMRTFFFFLLSLLPVPRDIDIDIDMAFIEQKGKEERGEDACRLNNAGLL